MTVNAGNPVTFSADADGFPVPTVAWSVSTDNGLTFNPVFGGITTTLSFTATQSQNGNIYRATFTNAAGSISTQARLTVGTAPTVSSDGAATFTAASGVQQFGVTTSGVPNAVITTSALPSWLTFTDNGDGTGTLSGDPAAGDGGAYPITITATNGFAPAATQSFVLTVTEPPTISSASAVSFGLGVAGSFVVQTAAGFPAATTVTRTGALPAGVTFVDNGDGTATLAGTPAAGTGGTYPLTLTASNGTGTDATQTLVLTVTVPPAITSAAAASFVLGVTGTFTVTATGVPRASLTTGVLPAWLTFADNGDGTGTFSGIPPVGSEGQHPITIAAHNGVGSGVSQSFVLTVTQTPVITSAAAATFTTGTFSAFTITTTAGYPTATTLTRTGALPAGVSFVDNGDGTATLAGTPAVGTGGLYGLTLTASNGTGAGTTRSFTLTVAQDPEFSSTNAATFTRGVDGTFTVTTRPSYPATTGITLTGSLPTGLSFADNGDGTATISGTTLDAAGTLTLGLTASNGSGPDAVQSFALTLADAATVPLPAILPTSDGPVGGVPSTVKPGDVLTLTASDFAGDAPVTFGIYSSPTVLAVVKADASGTATATVTIPAGLTGTHTLVASGIAPDGSRRFLLTAITLAGGSGSGSGGSGSGSGSSGSGSSGSGSGSPAAGSDPLASTGLTDVTGLALLAAFALIAGVSILTLRRRRS
jgi:hypothetical protein